MKTGLTEITFPVGGLNERYAFQRQPPYTTPGSSNVWPYDTIEGRERGGSRPGLKKAFSSQLGSGDEIQFLGVVDKVDAAGVVHHYLVTSCAGAISGNVASSSALAAASGSGLNAALYQIQSAQHLQKLYIADYRSTRIKGTLGVVANGDEFSVVGVSWSTTPGDATYVDPTTDVIVITGISTAEDDVFTIGSVEAGHLHLCTYGTATPSALTPDTGLTYEIGRPVKVFDPATGSNGTTANIVATFGIPPLNCPLVCTYRERLVLAGPDQIWYMSRQGSATDWDYGADADDAQRPVAGTSTEGAEIGEPIVALIPHSDDYLVFGCAGSLWVMRGDPTYGAQIDALSRETGIVGPNAWCKMPDGSVMFLSRSGINLLPAGGSSYPVSVSQELLPTQLLDIDSTANLISMCYDARARGVHIAVTPTDGSEGEHWFLDWTLKSFWKVEVPDAMQPTCMLSYAADWTAERHVLQGGHDGYIRKYDSDTKTDDGTALTSWVKIGPLKLGGPGYDGIVTEMEASLDESSDDVTWELMAGDTGETAATSTTAHDTGTWQAGRNVRAHPRVRGVAASLYLESTGQWSLETVTMGVRQGGRVR